MQSRELVLLEKLQELTAADADFEYSVLRGKLDADDVRAIHQGLQVAIETLPGLSVQQYVANLRWRICPSPCRIDLLHTPNKNGTGNEPDAVSVDSARCNAMPPIDLNVLQRAVSFPR